MTTLQEDLLKCTVDGNVISLPDINSTQLEDYPALRKALLNSGGKYKRSTFIFNTEAQPYVDRIMNGNGANIKKEFQFFQTPKVIINKMLDLIAFGKLSGNIKVLEPSAGQGHILDELVELVHGINRNRAVNGSAGMGLIDMDIDCCELMPENRDILNTKGFEVNEDNFLYFVPGYEYDLIIANPPFTKGQDIIHIMNMYSLLKEGGQLITISSPGWTFREDSNHSIFRKFIESNNVRCTELDEGAFKSSGTNIKTMLLSLTK